MSDTPELRRDVDHLFSSRGEPEGLASLDADGRVPTDELGSGTADSTVFLRGDRTWAAATPTFVGAKAFRATSVQSIPNSSHTAIQLNGESYDSDGIHDTATNNTRMTVPTGEGGKYLVIGSAEFAGNTTGIRQITFRLNGTTFLTQNNEPGETADQSLNVADVLDLAAGDYLELMAFQNSGGNLNVNFNEYKTFFTMVKQR